MLKRIGKQYGINGSLPNCKSVNSRGVENMWVVRQA